MNRRANSFFALRRMDDIDSLRPRTLIEQSGRTEERLGNCVIVEETINYLNCGCTRR